jgi:hypothetical protein
MGTNNNPTKENPNYSPEAGDRPLPDGKSNRPRSVIGGDYEVLGLASDRRHCFFNLFWAYIFLFAF